MKNIIILLILAMSGMIHAQQTCYTPAQVAPVVAGLNPDPLNGDYCVKVYVEVDHDIVVDKGPVGSRIFVEGLLSQVAALYAAQDIVLNYVVKYWDTPSPYRSNSTNVLLGQFRDHLVNTGGYDGDVAQLISYQASGGIAYVDVICRETFGYAFSSIDSRYADYPTYSWSVEVFAHELGHNLGSPHTQSCVWNGNMTAIDACSPFGTEGGCPSPPDPINGGTIMSYCHLDAAVGINFRKGFHPQPLALIKNRIANAQCVECVDVPDGPDDPEPDVCADNQVIIELQLDNYAEETTWEVIDDQGNVVGSSGNFGKLQMNTYHADTLCLPEGCYTFVITDVDGLTGYGCSEGMYIVNGESGELASGQNFTGSETTPICFGEDPTGCDVINLSADSLINYANQSRSPWAIVEDIPGGVTVEGNNWRALPYTYTITPNTVLEFEALVAVVGEIQGVSLVPNASWIWPDRTFQFAGTQNWGTRVTQVPVGEWKPISVNVGEYFTGDITHIVLVNDDDHRAVVKTGWRNMELCEDNQPVGGSRTMSLLGADHKMVDSGDVEWTHGGESLLRTSPTVPFPNPVVDTLTLPYETVWHLFDISGKSISEGWGTSVDMAVVPPGFYILHDGTVAHKIIKI